MVSLLIEWHANSQSPAAFRSQRYGQYHASPEPLPDKIPIDAKPLAASRGFVLRRLSDAGLCTGPSITSGRHPKPFTIPDISPETTAPPLSSRKFEITLLEADFTLPNSLAPPQILLI